MNTNINRCISKAFNQYGYSVELTDEEVEFPPLKIWITGKVDSTEKQEYGSVQVRIIVKTRHKELFPNGIFEYAYGWGENKEAAAVNAIYRWLDSDFNAIHDLLCTSVEHDHSDSKREMITASKNGTLIAWDVVFGPLIVSESEQKQEDILINDFFLKLYDLINDTLLNEKGIYPIKCFVMQNEEGQVSMDCRINGHFWHEGEVVLKEYAESWGLEGESHWRKQYFIILSKEVTVEQYRDLLNKLEQAERYLGEEKDWDYENDTYASNPAYTKLNSWVWTKHHLVEVLSMWFALLFFLMVTFGVSYGFSITLILVIFFKYFYWKDKKRHFKLGDSNGGIVVSLKPNLVAVTTDLTKGFGHYPALKIIEFKTRKPVKIGDRIPTVAMYSGVLNEGPAHWFDFNPIPLEYATNDKTEIERALSSYSDQQWKDIERRVAQLPKPLKVGLFKVDMNESDWKTTKSKLK